MAALERASVSGDSLGKLLYDVARAGPVAEVFVVSTCNRIEVYADVDLFHAGVTVICELPARHSRVPLDDLPPPVCALRGPRCRPPAGRGLWAGFGGARGAGPSQSADARTVPAVQGGFVARPALYARIAGAARVTTVSASAGSGKTFLLRSWVRGVWACTGCGWRHNSPRSARTVCGSAWKRPERCSRAPGWRCPGPPSRGCTSGPRDGPLGCGWPLCPWPGVRTRRIRGRIYRQRAVVADDPEFGDAGQRSRMLPARSTADRHSPPPPVRVVSRARVDGRPRGVARTS